MKKIETQFKKNGFQYNMLSRKGDIAIYEQVDNGKIIAYEVFEVQKNKEYVISGNVIPASESVPPTSAWGKSAYTTYTSEEASRYGSILQKRIDNRIPV